MTPERRIFNDDDLKAFVKHSPAYVIMSQFIESICIAATTFSTPRWASNAQLDPFCQQVINSILNPLSAKLIDFPPLPQSQRFGNRAFTQWQHWLAFEAPTLIRTCLSALRTDSQPSDEDIAELASYLSVSFGDPSRIDYGTGHELAFVAFLFVLLKVSGVTDLTNVTLLSDIAYSVLWRYWSVVRALQRYYMLEPAGSHGVWGLDDYFHLPFLIGAAQMSSQNNALTVQRLFLDITLHVSGRSSDVSSGVSIQPTCPSSVANPEPNAPHSLKHCLDTSPIHSDSLFAAGVFWSMSGKQGAPLSHTSPVLFQISRLTNWPSVTAGLMKMYVGEVLLKRPVVQHFLFGRHLPFE